jgi:uncharacterized RDD family membrane protein YckC
MIYDGLVLIAVLAIATFVLLPFLNGKFLIPSDIGWLAYAYRAWLILIATLFFAFFWTRSSGQTLGMQAWRLRIERASGKTIGWRIAFKRLAILWALTLLPTASYWYVWRGWDGWAFATACALACAPILGCYASIRFSSDRLAWHDRWTGTQVIVLPKR